VFSRRILEDWHHLGTVRCNLCRAFAVVDLRYTIHILNMFRLRCTVSPSTALDENGFFGIILFISNLVRDFTEVIMNNAKFQPQNNTVSCGYLDRYSSQLKAMYPCYPSMRGALGRSHGAAAVQPYPANARTMQQGFPQDCD